MNIHLILLLIYSICFIFSNAQYNISEDSIIVNEHISDEIVQDVAEEYGTGMTMFKYHDNYFAAIASPKTANGGKVYIHSVNSTTFQAC